MEKLEKSWWPWTARSIQAAHPLRHPTLQGTWPAFFRRAWTDCRPVDAQNVSCSIWSHQYKPGPLHHATTRVQATGWWPLSRCPFGTRGGIKGPQANKRLPVTMSYFVRKNSP